MAKIALRVYNNEIKDLTDHGQIEEAIAHCRHILETYPKHVDTYRLLGKAYLEEQRYSDAVDILQRVLSSIPEDFISQVGMSIIREDEGNLDAAIFHMERAFEVQPSNHAIQDELKRLYGRRDGIEPQKIRLTRGALARMYAHGNLHDLAIAELLAALSEDPHRYDLMVLLANMYHQAEKQVEAAETCTKILEKLPYCLDANRLMATILEVSAREENAKIYRGRWEELDPYAVALDKGEMNTEFVPNQTITVERLDWEPGTYDDDKYGRPAWATSLGVNIQGHTGEGSALPDWMNKREEGAEPPESIIGEPPDDRETPPLWESGLEQGEVGSPDLMPESAGFEDTLLPSDKPPEDYNFPSQEDEKGTPEWLRKPAEESLESLDESIDGEGEEIPDWMQTPFDSTESQKGEGLFPIEGDKEGTPEWMSSLQDESYERPISPVDDSEAIPDFMKEAGWEPSSGEEEIPTPAFNDALSDEQEEEIAEGEIPSWMQDLAHPEVQPGPGPSNQEETPLSGEMQEEVDQDIQAAIEGQEPMETPSWLPGLNSQEEIEGSEELEIPITTIGQPAEESESLVATSKSTDEDEESDWLESLAAKQGVAEEELITRPEERSETPPDWLQETTTEEETQPEGGEEPSTEWLGQSGQEAAEEAAPTLHAEIKPEFEEPPSEAEITAEGPRSSDEEEQGLGWLESLAAKQGVSEEELVTSPEDRREAPPDWLQETVAEEEPQPEGEEESSMEWLDQLSQEASEEVPPLPAFEEKPTEETESWLDRLSQPEEIPAAPVSESHEAESEEEKGFAWLEDLAPERGTEEEVESQSETENGLSMEWLDQLSQEAVEEAAPSVELSCKADEEVETWLGSLDHPIEDSEKLISEPSAGEADDELAWLENLAGSSAYDEKMPEASAQENIQDELVSDDRDDGLPEWILPEKEEPTEETPDNELSFEWLTETDQESPTEGEGEKEVKVSTDWLIEMSNIEDDLESEEELGSTPEAIDKIDEWIQSLDQPEPGEEKPLEPEIATPPIEPDVETAAYFTSTEKDTVESDAKTIPSYVAEDEPAVEEEPESDKPMVPEWLQDVAEQKPEPDAIQEPPEWLPEVEEPIVEIEEIAPAQPSEWQPESEVKAHPVEEETQPTPASKPTPQKPTDMLKEARHAVHEHRLDEAIDAYGKLIKRGKEIEETIEDIQEALRKHPINPALWQVLGDALMRSDRLQEALDAYSKAENLLR